ncbi:MAG: 2-dehydro-3-deoxy-6-phosphogalactonate aldolase [Burkholderiales bacterium]
MSEKLFVDWLRPLPLVAILRGIKPGEVAAVGEVLVETGIAIVEVPLNSPAPYASIVKLAKRYNGKVLVGAGTVTDWSAVSKIADAGGNLIVTPHSDERVVEAAKRHGLYVVTGFATPTEAFRMIEAGADAIKLFPAEANPPRVLKAIRAVLPREAVVLPVGGITPDSLAEYWSAGADGFGLGSSLFKPGASPAHVAQAAAEFRFAFNALPKRGYVRRGSR